jgi:hypothetical protein
MESNMTMQEISEIGTALGEKGTIKKLSRLILRDLTYIRGPKELARKIGEILLEEEMRKTGEKFDFMLDLLEWDDKQLRMFLLAYNNAAIKHDRKSK